MEAYVDGNSFLRSPSLLSSNGGGSPHKAATATPCSGLAPRHQTSPSDFLTAPKEEGNEKGNDEAGPPPPLLLSPPSPPPLNPEVFLPVLLPSALPHPRDLQDNDAGGGDGYDYVPLLAVRRQRVREEERFAEDPAVVEVGVLFLDGQGGGCFA